MTNAISKDVKIFVFSFDNSSCFEISEWFPTLAKVVPQIPEKPVISDCKLTQEEFEGLLVAAKGSKSIYFQYCKLSINSECNFGDKLEDSTFENIYFTHSGGSAYSHWESADFVPFKNLIKGLSKIEQILIKIEMKQGLE